MNSAVRILAVSADASALTASFDSMYVNPICVTKLETGNRHPSMSSAVLYVNGLAGGFAFMRQLRPASKQNGRVKRII